VAKNRLWKQITISFVAAFLCEIFLWSFSYQKLPTAYYSEAIECGDKDKMLDGDEGKHNVRNNFNLILGVSLSVYMLIGFYSIIYACRRLVRPGVSIEMRKLFLKKHALYVIVLIIIQLIQLLYNYYELFNPTDNATKMSPE